MKTNTLILLATFLVIPYWIFAQKVRTFVEDSEKWRGVKYSYNNYQLIKKGTDDVYKVLKKTEFDPYTLNTLSTIPDQMSSSMLIGKPGEKGAEVDRAIYTSKISGDKPILIWMYAIVVEDPRHEPQDQPAVVLSIKDEKGLVVDKRCGELKVIAGDNNKGFEKGARKVMFKKWTKVAVDLTPYIGQVVHLDFSVYDCHKKGHFGYAYISGYFTSMDIEVDYCKNENYATLTAPPGFKSYKWSNGYSGRTLTIKEKNNQTQYLCQIQTAMGCDLSLETKLEFDKNEFITIGVDSSNYNGYALSCANSKNGFIELKPIGGTPPYDFIFDKDTIYNESSGLFDKLGAGTYDFEIKDSKGCYTKKSITIRGPNPLSNNLQGSQSQICFKDSSGIIESQPEGGVPPYYHTWLSKDNQTFFSNKKVISDLHPGVYIHKLIDTNQCTIKSMFEIKGVDKLTAKIKKGGKIIINGGTPPYYKSKKIKTKKGGWRMEIIDSNGCSTTARHNPRKKKTLKNGDFSLSRFIQQFKKRISNFWRRNFKPASCPKIVTN